MRKKSNDAIFIVGVGRSGTSLVQSILASHSSIAVMPETAFVRQYIAPKKISKALRLKSTGEVCASLLQDPKLQQLNLEESFGALVSGHEAELNIYLSLQKRSMSKKGVSRYADKDPKLIEHFCTLQKYFPDSFVVHIIRDPRDVLCSKKKASWSRGRSTFAYCFANHVQISMAKKFGARLFGRKYIEITYEALTQHPEKTVRRLCQELLLNYETSMLNFSVEARRLATPEEFDWKKETFGPILKNNSNKWAIELSEEEIFLTELTCKKTFEIGDYIVSNAGYTLSWYKKLFFRLLKVLILLFAPLYMFWQSWKQR